EVDLSVDAAEAVSALTALGYGRLLTLEAARIDRPAGSPLIGVLAIVGPILLLVAAIAIAWKITRRSGNPVRDTGSTFTTVLPAAGAMTGAAAVGDRGLQPIALVALDDVAGCDEAKLELTEAIEFLRSPERFRRLGARIPR